MPLLRPGLFQWKRQIWKHRPREGERGGGGRVTTRISELTVAEIPLGGWGEPRDRVVVVWGGGGYQQKTLKMMGTSH